MIEKLGITENTPGWEDEAKREMLEALIDSCLSDEYEYPEDMQSHGKINLIEKATGLTWAQVKERIE